MDIEKKDLDGLLHHFLKNNNFMSEIIESYDSLLEHMNIITTSIKPVVCSSKLESYLFPSLGKLKFSNPNVIDVYGKNVLNFITQLNKTKVKNRLTKGGSIETKVAVKFGNCFADHNKATQQGSEDTIKPLLPNHARTSGDSYHLKIFVETNKKMYRRVNFGSWEEIHDEKLHKRELMYLMNLPIMLKSRFCHLRNMTKAQIYKAKEDPIDQGGYYIIKGKEKVLVGQERQMHNSLFVFRKDESKPSPINKNSRCFSANRGRNTNRTFIGEVRSVENELLKAPSLCKVELSEASGKITVRIPYFASPLPIFVVFKSLGIVSIKMVYEIIFSFFKNCDDDRMNFLKSQLLPSLEHMQTLFKGKRGVKRSGVENSNEEVVFEEDALSYILRFGNMKYGTKTNLEVLHNLFDKEFLPHCGHNKVAKALYLGYMAASVLKLCNDMIEPIDRDHCGNKCVDLSGPLILSIFRTTLKGRVIPEYLKMLYYHLLMRDSNVSSTAGKKMSRTPTKKKGHPDDWPHINSQTMNATISNSFLTGNWGGTRTGVCQFVSSIAVSHVTKISSVLRFVNPLPREHKSPKPRNLHVTSFGYVCPVESPEGLSAGLVKAFSIGCKVSHHFIPEEIIMKYLESFMEPEKFCHISGHWRRREWGPSCYVFLNGNIVGVSQKVYELAKCMRMDRRRLILPQTVSVYYDDRQSALFIRSDIGRFMRPLLVCDEETNLPLLKRAHLEALHNGDIVYEDLVRMRLVEYIDASESENCMIATGVQDYLEVRNDRIRAYTHMEIHPSLILGFTASLEPFPQHNQSPRNAYETSMERAKISIPNLAFQHQTATTKQALYYPQKSLVYTAVEKASGIRETHGTGNTVMLAIFPAGYNQEDSLIFSQRFIDLGGFRCFRYNTNIDKLQQGFQGDSGPEKLMTKLDQKVHGSEIRKPMHKLDNSGTLMVGEKGSTGKQVTLAKMELDLFQNIMTNTGERYKKKLSARQAKIQQHYTPRASTMEIANNGRLTYVNNVYMAADANDNMKIFTEMRETEIPEVGDKFSSRHAQKGVIGLQMRPEDMPFTASGITPDLIMNPHGFPSRMTIGQLLEMILTKMYCIHPCAETEELCDGTSFSGVSNGEILIEKASKILKEHGYPGFGTERMYSGQTGEMIDSPVFIAPVLYNELKHKVANKINCGKHVRHSRKSTLTRQSTDGPRFGEMERDCLISYGAAHLLQDRFMVAGDAYRMTVCSICGYIAHTVNLDDSTSAKICPMCNKRETCVDVMLPYATKLLFQELMSMSIRVKINTEIL